DGVVRVLQEVGARLARESIFGHAVLFHRVASHGGAPAPRRAAARTTRFTDSPRLRLRLARPDSQTRLACGCGSHDQIHRLASPAAAARTTIRAQRAAGRAAAPRGTVPAPRRTGPARPGPAAPAAPGGEAA